MKAETSDELGLYEGELYSVDWLFGACGVDCSGDTYVIELDKHDVFLLIDYLEITALNVIECQILFEKRKMWFNIQPNYNIIDNVKRAKSYDIPFTALRNNEPGSNSFSLTV